MSAPIRNSIASHLIPPAIQIAFTRKREGPQHQVEARWVLFNPKNEFKFNSCRHVGSKSSPEYPLQAVMYPASLHVFIPDDWLLSDPNPALDRF